MRRLSADGSDQPELYRMFRDRVVAPRQAVTRSIIERGIAEGSIRPDVDVDAVDRDAGRAGDRRGHDAREAELTRRQVEFVVDTVLAGHGAGSRRPAASGRMSVVPANLILLRHGESDWNSKNLFTGWVDVDLTAAGRGRGRAAAGELLAEHGLLPDVVHTSLLRRAIRTAQIALDVADRHWIPVQRSWRLNERHYGALQGKDKAAGAGRVRRGAVHALAPLLRRRRRRRCRPTTRTARPATRATPTCSTRCRSTECLADVVARMLPYWYDAIVPDLRAGRTVLVAAHGNSLRALIKHLDGLGDDEVVSLNVPTGIPLHYELDPTTPDADQAGELPRPGGGGRGDRSRRQPGQEVGTSDPRSAAAGRTLGRAGLWIGSGRSPVTMNTTRRATATAWSA